MSRELVNRFSDFTVEAIAPIDVFNNTVLNDAAGASSLFKVFDPSKDEVITVAEASLQTVLSISNSGKFIIGDDLECTLDNGNIHLAAVTVVDPVAGEITVLPAITDTMAVGKRIRVIMGVSVAMVEFGTADLNTRDWGYVGTFADDQAAQLDSRSKDGFDVDIEVQLDGGPGLAALEIHCITIKEKICDD